MKSPLTPILKERIKRLEAKLKKAVNEADFEGAKLIIFDIQAILRPAGQETKLMQLKNWYYEAAINAGKYDVAIDGLKAIKLKTSKQTRMHLEATTLLAIAYLRYGKLIEAEEEIRLVMKNDKVIKSDIKRGEFRRGIIQRFDEEVVLYGLKDVGSDKLDEEEIEADAFSQLENKTVNDLYAEMGNVVPQKVVDSLFRIDGFAKNQLPSAERLLLPSPKDEIKREKMGKTLFSSIKRTAYRSLCDPNSDVYKSWFNDGLKIILTRKYITSAIIATLSGLGIGIKALAASIVALILKFGIEVYCEHYKPDGIMELR